MQYLGIDVHQSASVWCLLDASGEQVATGRSDTTFPALRQLALDLRKRDELVAGQEVGTQAYLVNDAFIDAGVPLRSFNAAHLRMIAASRKKTDRRDAYWIAKSLQTGMTPHPVYLPDGDIRTLRRLLARRRMIQRDRNRWAVRIRASLRARGVRTRSGIHYVRKAIDTLTEHPDGVDTDLLDTLGLAGRMMSILQEELEHVEARLARVTEGNDVVTRLQTIPGVGPIGATTIFAAVGNIERFPSARHLASYAGLVPSVRQSGDVARHGGITKTGSPYLRATLVQSAHIASRSSTRNAEGLQAFYTRVRGTRGRRKIAIVALARHILRIAYYVWRDRTVYDSRRVAAAN